MTENQSALIKEFIAECKADGLPKKLVTPQLQSFLRSLGNQERDEALRALATQPAEARKLVDQYF